MEAAVPSGEPTRTRTGSPFAMARLRPSTAVAALVPTILTSCAPVDTRSSERFNASGELIALSGARAGASNACFTCHGLEGQGNGAGSPRLASLDVGYLDRQLEAFADGRRRHAKMSWIARQLSPGDRERVAAYYAAMPIAVRSAPRRTPPKLYALGNAQRGIPACASCHGVAGQGLGPANPPLAGQPAAYLAAQIEAWRRGERRTDPGGVMLRISQLLAPSESAALAAYAARLPGGLPNPEYREASPGGRRGDPRNDASGPPLHVPESARAGE